MFSKSVNRNTAKSCKAVNVAIVSTYKPLHPKDCNLYILSLLHVSFLFPPFSSVKVLFNSNSCLILEKLGTTGTIADHHLDFCSKVALKVACEFWDFPSTVTITYFPVINEVMFTHEIQCDF